MLRERSASLSSAAAKFLETRLAAARPKDVQPTLLLLHFAKSALPTLQPAHAAATVQALVRLLGVPHPVLTRHTTDTLLAAAAAEGAPPLPAGARVGSHIWRRPHARLGVLTPCQGRCQVSSCCFLVWN